MKIHKQFFKILGMTILFFWRLIIKTFQFTKTLIKSRETKDREAIAIALQAERNRLEIANKRYVEKFSGKRRYTKAVPTKAEEPVHVWNYWNE